MTAGTGRAPDGLTLAAGDDELHLALVGATPLRWLVSAGGHRWDALDGYRDAAELAAQDGVRNGVMAPFCNRVAGARYAFDGAEHDLLPGSRDRTVYHGLVRTAPFTVVDVETAGTTATAHLRCDALADARAAGYPFRVVVDVRYRLSPGRLAVEVAGTNVGTGDAPFAAGWHPYLRLPGARVDDLHLAVPATVAVVTDDDLVPLAGPAAYRVCAPLAGRVGGAVVDAAFRAAPWADGVVRSTLHDPATGLALTLEQDGGLVHVFTGDTLERDRRASLALEPVEVMTDALNRPDCADALRLAPGATRAFAFALAVTGRSAAAAP